MRDVFLKDFRPKLRAVIGLDELRRDAHALASLSHRAFDHMRRTKRLADSTNVAVLTFELEGGGSRDHAQALDVGERRADFVCHAVGEEFLLPIIRQVDEGQHGDGSASRLGWRGCYARLLCRSRAGRRRELLIRHHGEDSDECADQRPIQLAGRGPRRRTIGAGEMVYPGKEQRDGKPCREQSEE